MGSSSCSSSSSSGSSNLRWFNISKFLSQISEEQIPTQEDTTKYHQIGITIVNILETYLRKSRPTAQVLIAGSYGKGTAISNDSDFDIVIFFADVEPPFTKLLHDMERIIKKNGRRLPNFEWKARSSIHISFDVEGMQFDVTPAIQLDEEDGLPPANGRWHCFAPSPRAMYPSRQYLQTMDKVSKLEDPELVSYLYSSSLSIDAVMIVQRQAPFVHSVIRLCKYWAKHVVAQATASGFEHVIRGKSVLVETLAIHACYELTPLERLDKNMIKAFYRFLKYFLNSCELRLHTFVNYDRGDVPNSLYFQTPLVMDPANPYNNLLSYENFPRAALEHFQKCAAITMEKLQEWRKDFRRSMAELRKELFEFNDD